MHALRKVDPMTGQRRARSVVLLAVALTAGVAGCGPGSGPQRVPADGAPCSAMMPGPAESGEQAIRFGDVIGTEQSWRRAPDRRAEPGTAITTYILRRGRVRQANGPQQAALIDAAAARVGRGVALQDGVKPTVSKPATGAGEAVELRWATGQARNATRLQLIAGGYCEATILGARADTDIAAYFASVSVRP